MADNFNIRCGHVYQHIKLKNRESNVNSPQKFENSQYFFNRLLC